MTSLVVSLIYSLPLKEDPNNTNYHFIYGVLLEESGDQAGAVEAYRNAIKVDANNYNANFNLGVMLINEATEIIKERNNLGISDADLKKADELDPQIDAKLESALPQWEKVHELDPKDETAMSTLRYIYVQLKQNDKAEEMQNKIDAAGGGED
ncbi:MAG: tetratricopeptide repeat protein [Bacteroidota bacterium]